MTNAWTSFLGSTPSTLGDAADNRAAAKDAGGTSASAACTAEGADPSVAALCGKVGGEVVGVVWDGAVDVFGGPPPFNCSDLNATYANQALSDAEHAALPVYLRDAVTAATNAWDQSQYLTWDDNFRYDVDHCFPNLGNSMYNAVAASFYRRAIAENNAKADGWDQANPDAASQGLVNPYRSDSLVSAATHNKAQLGYGPGDTCTTTGGSAGIVDDNSVCIASGSPDPGSGDSGNSGSGSNSVPTKKTSTATKIVAGGIVVGAGVAVWKYRDTILRWFR